MSKYNWNPFVQYLNKLSHDEDRAALSVFRRASSMLPEVDIRVYPYLAPWFFSDNENTKALKIIPTIASLYALWHSGSVDQIEPADDHQNFGQSFAKIMTESESASKSIEQRFVALLDAHEDDLIYHLKQAVGLLRSKKIPINWQELAAGIYNWDHPNKFIQERWASGFWGTISKTTQQKE